MKLNKVCTNLNQDFTTEEMTTARNNIRAASSEQVNNHTEKIEANTTEIGQIKVDVADIESSLLNKKDKQQLKSFKGSSKQTIKNISQTENGELNVEFEDIDLLGYNITSSDGSINVSASEGVTDLTLPSDVVRDSAYTHIDAATANPLMNSNAAVGISTKYAREDHVHPSDTSKEAVSNKTTVVIGTSNSKYPTDKAVADFVNSSVATNTANYISNNGEPFTSVEQLEAYTGTVTNNDYAFVTGTDSAGNTYYDRYKATVSGSTVTWALEYRLNNSSFTAAQWSAINSGITSVLVTKIHDHSNKDVLDGITSDKVTSWDGKEDAFDVLQMTKGGTGINASSRSTLTSTLINSLNTGGDIPTDADYYVSQYAGGGTSNTTFVRRPVYALWKYIKGNISSVLGLTASNYSGKAATAGTADKAVADGSGNNIVNTYATKTEVNAKQNKLTAGDNITIDGNTISSNQIFVATYGTTKYAEVKTAYDAGKICTVFRNGRYYYMTWVNSDYIRFSASNENDRLYQVSVSSDNKWSAYSIQLQSKLTFDTTPTAGSSNPVTSNGIKTALDSRVPAPTSTTGTQVLKCINGVVQWVNE